MSRCTCSDLMIALGSASGSCRVHGQHAAAGFDFSVKDLGRGKWSGVVRVRSLRDLLTELRKHLGSREVDLTDDGTVIVGVFRPVGRVEPCNDIAKAQLRRWLT